MATETQPQIATDAGAKSAVLDRPSERNWRSVAKAASWRTLGSIDTFVLSAVITGNFKVAGSIAVVEVVTKMVLYYLHERAWGHIRWGKT